jgi:hypothetical protein
VEWSDLRRPVSRRVLRQFAGLWLACLAGLAAWLGLLRDDAAWSPILAAVSLVGFAGLAAPAAIRPFYYIATYMTFPIGWVLSRVILGVLFFGVFTPVAVVFRLVGRDALDRTPDPGRESYWEPKPAAASPDRYLRQY